MYNAQVFYVLKAKMLAKEFGIGDAAKYLKSRGFSIVETLNILTGV